MTILQHSIAQAAAAATGYQIARSLRFNSADTTYLTRTPSVTGNQQKFTFSGWVKRSLLSSGEQCIFNARAGAGTPRFRIFFNTNDALQQDSDNFGQLTTTQVFRDPSAWYHIVFAADSTQATSTERKKLYVNGVQVTVFNTSTYPTQNTNSSVNSTVAHDIGVELVNAIYFNGYISNVTFVDGQALTPSSFGANDPNTGVWSPVPYTGTYGTNGFWLKLDDNSNTTATTLGKDSSGNGNNWTPNNFSVTAGVGNDSLVDSPTWYGTDTGAGGEVRGNYCTWNPLFNPGNQTLTNGNLDIATGTTGGSIGTMQVSTGKWYWEIIYTTAMTAGSRIAGIVKASVAQTSMLTSSVYWQQNATYSINNAAGVSYGTTPALNDVIGVALDVDAQTIRFYKNGVAMSTAISISSVYSVGDLVTPAMTQSAGTSQSCSANFGQRPFAYTAPSGFKALCTTNLPTPAIGASASTLASKNFNAVLWTGNGTNPITVSGVGFQPDVLWGKSRSNAYHHRIADAVRGVGSGKMLYTSLTDAEGNNDAYGYISSFNSDGFVATAGATNNEAFNTSAATYVGWAWNAGGSTVTNTNGSISSQVRANAAAGISVVTYNGVSGGGTVGHGLGAAPKLIIVKYRGSATSWPVYHATIGRNGIVELNATGGKTSVSGYWGAAEPTSTVFGIYSGASAGNNFGTDSHVAYCFAEIPGFSKISSYVGNGSTDGPFVYCGFRPKFIICKTIASASAWGMEDGVRSPQNPSGLLIFPNLANAEVGPTVSQYVDFLSNGFKIRAAPSDELNRSGETYIFAAFAESPFQYSRAR